MSSPRQLAVKGYRMMMGIRSFSLLLLLVLGTFQFVTLDANGEDEVILNPQVLANHFEETTLFFDDAASDGVSDGDLAILRWARTSLKMAYLAPTRSKIAKSASIGIRLIVASVSDDVDIEQIGTLYADKGQLAKAAQMDILFLIADEGQGLSTLRNEVERETPERPGSLQWLRDDAAFGDGCGVSIGYEPKTKRIEKAILYINGVELLGGDSSALSRGEVDGRVFSCGNRQLLAALGLVRDWGRKVSVLDHSAFTDQRTAPLYDMAVIAMMYNRAFEGRLSPAKKSEIIGRMLQCFAGSNWSCLRN